MGNRSLQILWQADFLVIDVDGRQFSTADQGYAAELVPRQQPVQHSFLAEPTLAVPWVAKGTGFYASSTAPHPGQKTTSSGHSAKHDRQQPTSGAASVAGIISWTHGEEWQQGQ